MDNGSATCSPEAQRRIVKELIDEANLHLQEGSLYYVVSSRWFSCWERYVGQLEGHGHMEDVASDSLELDTISLSALERPGPVNNSDIVENGGECEGGDVELSRTLLESRDYILVPEKVWDKLIQWYTGGPALPRRMISEGVTNRKQFSVEVYPLNLKLIDSTDNSVSRIRISKKASVRELYENVSRLRGIEIDKISLWDYFNKCKNSRLTDLDKSLQDSHLHMDQEILLELQNDGSSPSHSGRDSTGNELALVALEPPRSTLSIAGGPIISNGNSTSYSLNLRPGSSVDFPFNDGEDRFNANTSVRKAEKGGLAGLQNLGNTCFMNSALQCLVHTPQLVEYFLQDYSEEINQDNPLGMHGELALAFGDLLRKLWSSGRTTVAPRAFKGKLALFAPQFSGYNQHDSQELLAFLLDGLHEDLNRVKRKPYIEMKDWDGQPDEEVAGECWRNHKARNDSVIVDVCQGQYKSTLVCPDCSKISITFDPFMYLSLPLPSTVTRSMTVTVFYGDGSGLPMPYTVSVLKHGNCRDLSQALASACCLRSDESLLLAEVYEHKIYRLLETPSEQLVGIKDEDHIVAFRLPGKLSGKRKLEFVHREKSGFLKGNGKHFGTPLITYLEEDVITGADIELAVSALLSPLKRRTSSATIAHGDKENGFPFVPNGELPNGSNGHFEPSDQSMDEVEEETSNQELPLQLFTIDDRYSNPKPILKDTVINSASQRIKVLLEWSEKEHRMYDASYLKDLPEVYHKTGLAAKKTRQEAVSLFSCLEAFLTEEPLGPDDMWYCPKCKEHRQASKKLDLWALPDILVFHLKRFSYSRYMKNKLDTFVDFPIYNLDLTKYVKQKDGESYIYELYAISNHYGGLGGGHYTAFAKLIDENKWYNFDDSRVSPCSESEIKSSAAYVLFYQRVKPDTTMEIEEVSGSSVGT